jgi:hypothetical protein
MTMIFPMAWLASPLWIIAVCCVVHVIQQRQKRTFTVSLRPNETSIVRMEFGNPEKSQAGETSKAKSSGRRAGAKD